MEKLTLTTWGGSQVEFRSADEDGDINIAIKKYTGEPIPGSDVLIRKEDLDRLISFLRK